MNCAPNALVSPASTNIARHGGIDLRIAGIGCARKQCRCAHELACLTVPTLCNVLVQPCLLQLAAASPGQPLDRRYGFTGGALDGKLARTRCHAIDVNRARTAGADAAAELGSSQSERVAQHPQQWSVFIEVDILAAAIDNKCMPPHLDLAVYTVKHRGMGHRDASYAGDCDVAKRQELGSSNPPHMPATHAGQSPGRASGRSAKAKAFGQSTA